MIKPNTRFLSPLVRFKFVESLKQLLLSHLRFSPCPSPELLTHFACTMYGGTGLCWYQKARGHPVQHQEPCTRLVVGALAHEVVALKSVSDIGFDI